MSYASITLKGLQNTSFMQSVAVCICARGPATANLELISLSTFLRENKFLHFLNLAGCIMILLFDPKISVSQPFSLIMVGSVSMNS